MKSTMVTAGKARGKKNKKVGRHLHSSKDLDRLNGGTRKRSGKNGLLARRQGGAKVKLPFGNGQSLVRWPPRGGGFNVCHFVGGG